MTRYKYVWNQNKFERFLREGRGKGHGKDYKPWITTQDIPSTGRRSRVPGWKTGRLHHTLSDNEIDYLYLLEWSDDVIDIREQFPLIDLEVAQTIASDMGVKYPTDEKTGFPRILTADFFITIQVNGQTKDIARTIKPAIELDRKRVIEKFEIERRYWTAKGIDWGIVTEREIPKTLVSNIEEYHSNYRLEPESDITLPQMLSIADFLKEKLRSSQQSVLQVMNSLDQDMRLETGTCLRIFNHLVAKKEILLDLTKKVNLNKSARSLVTVVSDKDYKERRA